MSGQRKPTVSRWRHVVARSSLLIALAACGGCGGDGSPARYPVEGQVLVGSKPVAEATVIFHPLQGAPAELPKPMGTTDAEGRFRLTTLTPSDGAAPGEYAVTVELRALKAVGEEEVREGKHLLPARYARSETSGLTQQVSAGPNRLAPIVLKAR